MPRRIQRSRCEIEARATKVAGPLLIPDSQTNPGDGELTGSEHRGKPLGPTDSILPRVDRSLHEAVEVEVGRAGHFVSRYLSGLSLSGSTRARPHPHRSPPGRRSHRHVEVVPDQGRRGRRDGGRLRRLPQWRTAGATAVDEEAVIDVVQWMHGVDVGHHASRGLRLRQPRSRPRAASHPARCRRDRGRPAPPARRCRRRSCHQDG